MPIATLFPNSQEEETPKCPLEDELTDKQNMAYPYNGILLSLKMGRNSDTGSRLAKP